MRAGAESVMPVGSCLFIDPRRVANYASTSGREEEYSGRGSVEGEAHGSQTQRVVQGEEGRGETRGRTGMNR